MVARIRGYPQTCRLYSKIILPKEYHTILFELLVRGSPQGKMAHARIAGLYTSPREETTRHVINPMLHLFKYMQDFKVVVVKIVVETPRKSLKYEACLFFFFNKCLAVHPSRNIAMS